MAHLGNDRRAGLSMWEPGGCGDELARGVIVGCCGSAVRALAVWSGGDGTGCERAVAGDSSAGCDERAGGGCHLSDWRVAVVSAGMWMSPVQLGEREERRRACVSR